MQTAGAFKSSLKQSGVGSVSTLRMGDYGFQNCGLVTHMRESAPKHPAQCDAWNASFSTGASDFPKPTKRFVKRLGGNQRQVIRQEKRYWCWLTRVSEPIWRE